MVKAVLSLIPWPWRIALLAGLALALGGWGGFAAWKGYSLGHSQAEAQGRAALESLRAEYNSAYAQAMERLNAKLRQQTESALAAESALARERQDHAETENRLQARIAAVTAGSRHTFSPAFVRMWNDAVGAGSAGDAGAGVAPGPAGAPGASKAAGSGVLARGTGVSEADVLAYIIYYGARARNLEAQVNAWVDYSEALK